MANRKCCTRALRHHCRDGEGGGGRNLTLTRRWAEQHMLLSGRRSTAAKQPLSHSCSACQPMDKCCRMLCSASPAHLPAPAVRLRAAALVPQNGHQGHVCEEHERAGEEHEGHSANVACRERAQDQSEEHVRAGEGAVGAACRAQHSVCI